MADIRCPMCGMENPSELDVCKHCHARLKPLIYSPPLGDEQDNGFDNANKSDLPGLTEQAQNEDPDTRPLVNRAGEDSSLVDEPSGEDSGEALDWLSDFKEEEAGEGHETAESSPEAGVEKSGDTAPVERWIFEEESANETQSDFAGRRAPSVTDWLASLDDRTDQEGEGEEGVYWNSESGEAAGEGADELPDWLKNLAKEEDVSEDSGLPGWLFESKVEPEPPEQGEGLDQTAPENSFEDAEHSLEEGAFEAIPMPEINFDEASFDDELPEWLQQMGPTEEEPQTEGEQHESALADEQPDLEPADLPEWVASMRPADATEPLHPGKRSEAEEPEVTGPLSGLRGLLQVEPVSPEHQVSTGLSLRLHATANQRNHADLLVGMLEHTWEPLPARQPVDSTAQLVRWGIALVLFLAVLWPVATGVRLSPDPVPGEASLIVNQIIDQLPTDPKVLVAFDYQPGRAGEMEAASQAAISKLVQMGAYLTMVSTNSSGPALAERLMHNLPQGTQAGSGQAYLNLGFIPGGPVGLLSFARSPQQTLPYTIDGTPAWDYGTEPALPPLEGIRELRDFDMLLVIVDDPTAGRYWIEQVRPTLEHEEYWTPMVMISSAQAEPLLIPYFQAYPRQLDGLMTSLRDGYGYAQLTGQYDAAGKYWDAFSSGLFAAVMILFIGGVAYFVLGGNRSSERAEGIL